MFKALNRILKFNTIDEAEGGQSDIIWTFFSNRFGSDYTRIKKKLEDLGLLEIERIGRGKKGLKCFGYRLTETCLLLLSDSNREYLHKLMTDKATKRRLQKNISERRYRKKIYGDARDRIKETIDGISFKETDIDCLCQHYTPEKAAFVRLVLAEIVEKNYGDLQHNEKDNRIPNPYTQLPAEVKTLIQIHGLKHIGVADIRSAYPSMWAHWLCSLHPDMPELEEEKAAYERIFLDPSRSPKEHLADLLAIPLDDIKDVMISYFNGKGFRKNVFVKRSRKDPFVKFDSWLKSSFPNLYRLWTAGDISQTGNQIGKHFETKLMLDECIYQKARSLGLVIGYENDGFSIFGNVPKDHASVRELLDFVAEQSIRLLGIKLVIVHKETPKWNPLEIQRNDYTEKIGRLYDNWKAFCRRFFSVCGEQRNWGQYEARQAEFVREGKKCFRVLDGLDAIQIRAKHPASSAGGSS